MRKAVLKGRTHPDYIDYLMSQQFGLGWKGGDLKRMNRFIHIIGWETERANKSQEPIDNGAVKKHTFR